MQLLAEWQNLAEHRHGDAFCDAQAKQRIIGPLLQLFRSSSAHFSWYHCSKQDRAGMSPGLSCRAREGGGEWRCEMGKSRPLHWLWQHEVERKLLGEGRKHCWISAAAQQAEERTGLPRGTPQLSTTPLPVLMVGDWLCSAITCTDHSGGVVRRGCLHLQPLLDTPSEPCSWGLSQSLPSLSSSEAAPC